MKLAILIFLSCLVLGASCNPVRGNEIVTKTVTAYCNNDGKGCKICNGKWAKYNLTADGHTPTQGVTIAASRAIPFGTKIKILGHVYTVQDRLAISKDHFIDIYFNKHSDALKWGKKTIQVEIIK